MTSKSLEKLGKYFVGETVIFFLKDMSVAAVTDDGESMKISGMTEGYVVDVDETFFYIGSEDGSVHKVVNHNVIGMVEIAETEEEEIMAVQIPTEDEEIH